LDDFLGCESLRNFEKSVGVERDEFFAFSGWNRTNGVEQSW